MLAHAMQGDMVCLRFPGYVCRELCADNNLLHGHIPPSIAELEQLRRLNLEANELCGPLPSFSKWGGIEEVLLGNNRLSGPFPVDCYAFRKKLA